MSTLAAPMAGYSVPEPKPEATPVDTIRTVLHRDVAAILRANLPALALVPQDKVYDRVMDDPALLHQAFRLLRGRPELFKQLVMTRERSFPGADTDPLWCGRTLAEVVALVVRACARRYFRRHLSAPRRKSAPAQAPGMFQSLAIGLGLVEKPRPVRKAPSLGARAERLYESLRDVLLYDWQVPLIPAYSVLEPATVKALGPKLLDLRQSFQISVLADHNAAAQLASGKVPLLLDDARRLMIPDGSGINAEILWAVSQKIHLNHLFPHWDSNESRRALSVIASTSPDALATMAPVLGGDIRVFTLFLFTAYSKLEAIGYKQVFGPQGKTWMVRAIAERLIRNPLGAPSLDLMKVEMERSLDGLADAAPALV